MDNGLIQGYGLPQPTPLVTITLLMMVLLADDKARQEGQKQVFGESAEPSTISAFMPLILAHFTI